MGLDLAGFWTIVGESFVDFAMAIPMVLAGIAVLGSIYYFGVLPAAQRGRGARGLVSYLFPKDLYRSRSARIDFWVWLINGLIIHPLFMMAVALGGMLAGETFNLGLRALLGPQRAIAEQVWAVVAIQFLASFFGQGFGQYWSHLAMHKIPALWALHRAHHSAESANLFAFSRSHPVEIFINSGTRVACGAILLGVAIYMTGGTLLPQTINALVWYNLLYVILGGFRSVDHTHIPIRFGKGLDILIGSPIMHQVHHSAEPQHRDVNMGGSAYIYDWIFGTAYVPRSGETWRWGLNDEEMGEHNPHPTLRAFFVEPLRECASVLKGKPVGPAPGTGEQGLGGVSKFPSA